jgi:hypothetical protein
MGALDTADSVCLALDDLIPKLRVITLGFDAHQFGDSHGCPFAQNVSVAAHVVPSRSRPSCLSQPVRQRLCSLRVRFALPGASTA